MAAITLSGIEAVDVSTGREGTGGCEFERVELVAIDEDGHRHSITLHGEPGLVGQAKRTLGAFARSTKGEQRHEQQI